MFKIYDGSQAANGGFMIYDESESPTVGRAENRQMRGRV